MLPIRLKEISNLIYSQHFGKMQSVICGRRNLENIFLAFTNNNKFIKEPSSFSKVTPVTFPIIDSKEKKTQVAESLD